MRDKTQSNIGCEYNLLGQKLKIGGIANPSDLLWENIQTSKHANFLKKLAIFPIFVGVSIGTFYLCIGLPTFCEKYFDPSYDWILEPTILSIMLYLARQMIVILFMNANFFINTYKLRYTRDLFLIFLVAKLIY